MKKVEAFIRHEAFEPIRMELLDLGFPSLTISEVKGSGRQKGVTERYRGAELTNYLRPKVKIECVVATQDVQTIVDTILKHARTGSIGDGKVFVMPVEEAYRIRTGESGEETLQAHPGAAQVLLDLVLGVGDRELGQHGHGREVQELAGLGLSRTGVAARDHRRAEARDDDRHGSAGRGRGQLGDAAEAVAGQHRVDHLQVDGAKPLDERPAAGTCSSGPLTARLRTRTRCCSR